MRNPLSILSLFAFLIVGSSARSETRNIIPAAQKIDGKYIVVFDDEKLSASQSVQEVATQTSALWAARIDKTYTHVFKGLSVGLSERQAQVLSQDPRVKLVMEDSRIFLPENETRRRKRKKKKKQPKPPVLVPLPPVTWGLDRLDQVFLPVDGEYRHLPGGGEGVNVYVVDSGIRSTHEEFEGRATFGVNTTPFAFDGDCEGHGTNVAGAIGGKTYGVAKKVNLISVKIFGEHPELGCAKAVGNHSWLIEGIDWISKNVRHPAVVNMSLGGDVNPVLDEAVRNLVAQGITVVIAAGNRAEPVERFSPARVAEAITVGASDPNDSIADYSVPEWGLRAGSNWGPGIDLFAPGENIETASRLGDDEVEITGGTSLAAPHVTGFVALLLQKNPSLTPARIENIVKDHATKGLVRGLENYPGTPNRLLSIRHVPDLTDFARLDPYFYLAMNPDVSAAVGGVENYAGGAAHWATQGVHQGRMSSPAHWPGYYFYLYQDLANFFGHNSWSAAHNHWYHSGRAEGRSGSPAFDPIFYFSLYPELERAFGRNNFRLATDHWIQNGIDEGRVGSVAFDPFFYLSAHGDVRAVVGEGNYRKALLHWFQYGINEGRRASWFFDPVAYFRHNPDLAGVFGATNYRMGLFHYIKHGRFEGRRAVP